MFSQDRLIIKITPCKIGPELSRIEGEVWGLGGCLNFIWVGDR